jgi:hypothetical protein
MRMRCRADEGRNEKQNNKQAAYKKQQRHSRNDKVESTSL